MRVVSYYTPSYRPEADRLVSSLRRLGLGHEVIGVADQGGWSANTQLKPIFLRRMLQLAREPVLWLDSDAVVWRDPELLHRLEHERPAPDLACFYRPRPDGSETLLSGTLWLNHTAAALGVLERWIEANAATPREWDQITLQRVLAEPDCDAVVHRLGPEYCFIFDAHRPGYGLDGEPIIEHFQASRRLKVERAEADAADARMLFARSRRPLQRPPWPGRPLALHPDPPLDRPEVFVVGGGASLRDFDWRRLDFRFTIAVNRAWEVLPAASVHFTASERFHSWVSLSDAWRRHPALKVVLDREHWPYGEDVWTVPASDRPPPSLERGIPDAGASGHTAVALALALGARRIHLLGFDDDAGAGRWHPGYPWPDAPVDQDRRQRELDRLIERAGPERIRRHGERPDFD